MDEARRAYHQDVAVRSVQKNSARHKANGASVAKLGNKQPTWKEIMDKHGEIITYPSTDNFMAYSDFTRLPNDLKVEFVNKICDRYDISHKIISRHLFNKGDDGLRAYLANNKCIGLGLVDLKKKRGDSPAAVACFRNDVQQWKDETKKAAEKKRIQAQMKKADCPAMMEYADFKKLTPDDQIDFLNRTIKYYQISSAVIAKELFDIQPTSLCNHLQRLGVNKKLEHLPRSLVRNKEAMYENTKKFQRYISAWNDFKDADKEEKEPIIDIPVPAVPREVLTQVTEKVLNDPDAVKKILEEPPKKIPEDKTFDFEDFVTEIPCIDDEPALPKFRELTKEEAREVVHGSLVKFIEMSETERKEESEKLLSTPNDLPDDEEFEFDIPEDPVPVELKSKVKEPEPEPEPEPDPMEYHEMHFSTSYISSGINMDEIYALAAFFKRCKRVKVSIDISEV